MNELLILMVLALAVISIALYIKLLNKTEHAEAAKQISDKTQKTALDMVDRLAERSTLNRTEIMEAIAEQSTTLVADSDKWSIPLPYGKWEKFPDEKGRPEPEIRGYWLGYPGRLIGVKMPEGSEYDMHSHPWVEILVGGAGVVWVEIELKTGEITRHRLGPEDVVKITPNVKHAVARAETAAAFVCIWGLPLK